MNKYDVIIIGAGHNGLVAASYLAKAGKKVLVLEANSEIGGASTSEYVFAGLTTVSYGVILLFIYLLFKSHKAISATDNAKKLMESILKTRRVIKYYVIYNLVMALISMVFGMYFAIINDPKLTDTISHFNQKQMLLTYTIMIGVTAAFIFIIWIFYKLLYGLLLKRLNRNYQELKKLEV